MDIRDYYKNVPNIKLYDPLSDLLGGLENGITDISFLEIVKMAGHSCPTVGGAYLMTSKALTALYGSEIPVRGEIKVSFPEDEKDGVAGVIANVITNITGATEFSGFKGLGGRFARHSLMEFNVEMNASARFTRIDTNKTVDVFYNPQVVGGDPRMMPLMQKVVSESASTEEANEFKKLWQQRVKEILIDNWDNEALVWIK